MAFTKGATYDEFSFEITELSTRKFDNYDSFSTYPSVGPFGPNYLYAITHHLISVSLSVAAIIPAAYIIASLFRCFINGLSGRNRPVDVNKRKRIFLFNPDNLLMKTLGATTQLGGFNQRLLMRQSNKCFPYRSLRQHKYDAIGIFSYSVQAQDGTTAIELIVFPNTLLTDVYAIESKSGLNIATVLQDRFRKRVMRINIWSDNSQ